MSIFDKLNQAKEEKFANTQAEGLAFLKENGKKENVTSLPSGLQYEVITMGTGAKPTAAQNVTCHYEGSLINGTLFDSSVKRGQPATFLLNRVISGWTEGLQLMPLGSKFRFFIPPHLGYGDRQAGAHIQPYSTLIFDVELLGIS
ncbi:MAG: FKBP-type peptidyl-prolyl cis-trans isomerase [Panacibacter sp.]